MLIIVLVAVVAVSLLSFSFFGNAGFLSLAGNESSVSNTGSGNPLTSEQKLDLMDKILEESRGLKEILEENGKDIESVKLELAEKEFTSVEEVEEYLFDSASQKYSADIPPEDYEELEKKAEEVIENSEPKEIVVVEEEVKIGGKVYTPEELLMMTEAQRQALYEQYQKEQQSGLK